MAVAQQPHNEVAFDKSNNSLTTVHYGYGNSVEAITHTGQDQTTIKVNNYGMPTEITNSLATVAFQYAGTSSVKVTQTVNGQTKTSNVPLDSKEVLNYREEYKKFNQTPSLIDKADQFLAGGGAKMIGGVVDLITEKLDNPIGACFQEALNAAKQTENPIIPISTLEALNNVANLELNPISYLTDMLKSGIFDNYKDWTQAVSDLIYKYQMEKYKKQKESNGKENAARIALTNTLMANGVSMEDAANAVNNYYSSTTEPSTSAKPKVNKPNKEKPEKGKNDVEEPDKGKPGMGEPDKEKNEGDEPGEDDSKEPKVLLNLDSPDGVLNYIGNLINQKNRGIPQTINVSYNRYTIWDPVSYDLKWNEKEQKYDILDYTKYANGAQPIGAVLDNPFVFLIIWWGGIDSEELRIPIAKPVDNRKYKY